MVTTPLVGELGVIKTSPEGALKNEIGLDLKASGSALIAEFTCGSSAGKWRGSVIVALKTDKGISSETLKFSAKAGKQKPEAFEGLPRDVIERSLGGAEFEQSGWSLTTTLTNTEKVEVNTVV